MLLPISRGRRAQLVPEDVPHVLHGAIASLTGNVFDGVVGACQQALRKFDAQSDNFVVDRAPTRSAKLLLQNAAAIPMGVATNRSTG